MTPRGRGFLAGWMFALAWKDATSCLLSKVGWAPAWFTLSFACVELGVGVALIVGSSKEAG